MRELCIEGVATHDDPESCVGVREGEGEALTGARVGRAIEPRNQTNRGADAVDGAEGHAGGSATRELSLDPARSENLSMRGISMHENREIPRLPIRLITERAAQGRSRPNI